MPVPPLNAASRPVLVTGANGLVGSRLVARLCRAHRVVAVGRGPPQASLAGLLQLDARAEERLAAPPLLPAGSHAAPADGAGLRAGAEYVDVDLLLPDALRDLIASVAPAAVFHAAATTDVDACERDPALAWALNVRAVEAAALGCREAGSKLVAFSTDYVFDGERGPYSEEDVPNPRGAYARTKRAGEEAALLLAPGALVCRVAVVFSGRPAAKRTFAVSATEALLAGREVRAFHDQHVSPTLADDAAAMSIGVWEAGAAGIWHCVGGSVVSRVEFCRALARKLGADERLVVPTALADARLPAPRPARAGLKVDKVRGLLGPSAAPSLDSALDRFLAERAGRA